MKSEREIAIVPTEGKWFEIKPLSIDQNLFKKEREDEKQEKTRVRIIEAFEEMKKYPEKYARNFQTMMPKKDWETKAIFQLKYMAMELGDHVADWVEQSLEWAQRIANGESWESICNDADTANWFRLVIWKHEYNMFLGGSVCSYDSHPASDIASAVYDDLYEHSATVPLVVSYEE